MTVIWQIRRASKSPLASSSALHLSNPGRAGMNSPWRASRWPRCSIPSRAPRCNGRRHGHLISGTGGGGWSPWRVLRRGCIDEVDGLPDLELMLLIVAVVSCAAAESERSSRTSSTDADDREGGAFCWGFRPSSCNSGKFQQLSGVLDMFSKDLWVLYESVLTLQSRK
jgi:hypothetical protein